MRTILIVIVFVGFILANPALHNGLLSVEGWNIIENTENGFTVSQMDIPGYPMSAIKVEVDVELTSEILLSVIHDVKNYDQFLSNAKLIEFELVSTGQESLIGYQHIEVPLFSNRHYLYKFDLNTKRIDNKIITGWELIPAGDDFQKFVEQKNTIYDNPVYLSEGAGRFVIEEISDSKVRLSYRLYMDIGGWIPRSLVEMSNTQGILTLMQDLVIEAKRRS